MSPRTKALTFSAAVYAVSLFCPVFDFEQGHSGFLLGFVCLLFGFGEIAWFANPVFFAGLLAFRLRKDLLAGTLAAIAVAIAMTTIRITEVPKNEGGQMTNIQGFGPGFYLWVTSMVILLVVAGRHGLKTPPTLVPSGN
jgi:ABC-type branched-subunit amino acid transport system permease subunit